MRKIIICSTSVMILALPHHIHGIGDRIRDQAIILEHSGNFAVNAVFNTVRKDLLSKDDLLQNAGCIILLKMLDRLANRDREAEICFSRLADDAKVVNSVASIIDMRSPGWYNRAKYNENDDDIRINSSFIRYTTGAMRNHVREGKGGAMKRARSLVRKKPGVDVIHVGNRYDLLPLFKEHRQWREFMKICRKLKLKHYGRTPDFRRFYSDEKEIERVIDGLRTGGFTVCIYKKMYDVKSIDNV